jgi:type 1 glutamine amidotransferase
LRPFKEWTTPDAKIDFILQPRTASRYWEVEPKDKQMVLVHYADERDRPALLERSAPRGSGKVLMFTTTLSAGNPAWNNYLEATTSFYPVLVSLCTKYLAGDDHTSGPPRKLHVVLAAGPKDHGPGDHDYPLWQKRWQHILGKAKDLEVGTAFGWPSAEQWQKADVIVFNSHHEGWKADKARDLDALLARGGGLVYLHWAISGLDATDVLARRIGLSVGKIKYRHGPLEIDFDSVHPITRGFGKLRLLDESYWNLTGDPEQINVLGSAVEEGKARPLFWTREQDRGRIFVSIPGHYTWTFDDPLYRILVLRGMAWTARQPIDRLCGLATYGARMAE